jgi:hypothetical protein
MFSSLSGAGNALTVPNHTLGSPASLDYLLSETESDFCCTPLD